MFEPPFRIKNMMPGMIMLWYGSVATIPSGWALCDGTQGTPDLRDRLIVSVGTTFDPGDFGGVTSHSHDFVGDGHSHDLLAGNTIIDSTPGGDFNHETNTVPATGTTVGRSNWPPYYALCYIMKL